MHTLFPFSVLLYASVAVAWGTWGTWGPPKYPCLTDAEALDIAARWLHLWDVTATGQSVVTSLSDLTSILSPNIMSVDETYPPPTVGIQAFNETVTAPGNTTTDVKQVPLFAIHSCDQIATRWIETAYSTGYNS
jgi:hypothetical protein